MFKRTIAAIMILAAMLCLAVKVDAAKPDKWLIYWYVCGTDIETTRIAFSNGTDLMSDDPNALILAEPDRNPGDATRCIQEVEAAELSPDVKIFMQAGGTYIWGHKNFRDLNAKIQTKAVVYNKVGEDEFQPIQGTVLTGMNVNVRQWFLDKNEVLGYDENNLPIRSYAIADNGKVGRYVYDKDHRNWHARELLPIPNDPTNGAGTETDMGSLAGLVSFLQAGQELERSLYPDGNVRRVLIFVDHGVTYLGGLSGVCSDEYTDNHLSLKAIQDAFATVKNGWSNPEEKPFEVVAFDACVMSAYETAQAVKDAANYMVASQEETIGCVMFGYTDLLNDLSKNPSMSGAELGKVICQTYWNDSKAVDKKRNINTNSMLTLSVTDLSENKMDALKTAYDEFSQKALDIAGQNPEEFVQTLAKFYRAANAAEKYPSDARASVFSRDNRYDSPKLIDLKGFAKNAAQRFPKLKKSGDALAAAIDNAVIYQKRGEGLNRGGGLSIFYPFDLLGNNGQNIADYQAVAQSDKLSSEIQGQLYKYMYDETTSNLKQVSIPRFDPETKENQIDPETGKVILDVQWQIPAESIFNLNALSAVEVQLDENKKTAWVELDEQDRNRIDSVRCQVLQISDADEENERISGLYLGLDNSMRENWETGKFESTFNGKWLMLDGHIVSSFVANDATKKNNSGKKVDGTALYVVPIRLNGADCALLVSCIYPNEKFRIVGARPIPPKGQMTLDGDIMSLNKGDVVQPLFTSFNLGEGDLENVESEALRKYNKKIDQLPPEIQRELIADYAGLVPGNSFTIGDAPKVTMGDLPDGIYAYIFEFFTPVGGAVRANQVVAFSIKDGKVASVKHLEELSDIKQLELETAEK